MSLLLQQQPSVFGVVTFPTLLIDERSFPTTNYGNNAERDEAHNPAAALHNSVIPQNKWNLSIRYSLKWEKTTFLPQQLFQVLLFLAPLLRSNHFRFSSEQQLPTTQDSPDIIQSFRYSVEHSRNDILRKFIFQKHFVHFHNCMGN